MMPPKSTALRLEHFDEEIYNTDPDTVIFALVDALCGDSGAGSLKKEVFIQRLSAALEGMYFSDLDYVFGNMRVLSRAPSEAYSYAPTSEMLTADQWDEVRVKDAWFRSRIKDFFTACTLGSTPRGVRMMVQAAISANCTLYETWQYADQGYVGRSGSLGELVIQPQKETLDPQENRLLRQMLDKIRSADAVFSISLQGLAVASPTPIAAASADSTYYEIQQLVTPTPDIAKLPPPELLPIDLDPTEQWLFSRSPEIAPYAAFNISQESSYYYLMSGGPRSPIDQVSYGTLQPDGSVTDEPPFTAFSSSVSYTDWTEYEIADAPDNFPGGKFGITPYAAPALNPDGTSYVFAYPSQADYIAIKKAEVLEAGGQADNLRYRLPVQSQQNRKVFTPDLAVAWNAPNRESTVTTSWTARRRRSQRGADVRNYADFVR